MELQLEQLTLEQLPRAFFLLYTKVDNVERLLCGKKEVKEDVDRWMNISEYCLYDPTHPARATVYSQVAKNEIPFHKRGKKLYFLKSEIDSWLKEGRKKTRIELAEEAEQFSSSR